MDYYSFSKSLINLGNGTKKRAIETGLGDVDEKLYIDNADLVIIAGRPSMGKSAFLFPRL